MQAVLSDKMNMPSGKIPNATTLLESLVNKAIHFLLVNERHGLVLDARLSFPSEFRELFRGGAQCPFRRRTPS